MIRKVLVWFLVLTTAAPAVTFNGGAIVNGIDRHTMRPSLMHDTWFDVVAQSAEYRAHQPPSTVIESEFDYTYEVSTAASSITDFYYQVVVPSGRKNSGVTRTSSNQTNIEPDPTNPARWIGKVPSGAATLTIQCPDRSLSFPHTVGISGGGQTRRLLGFDPASVRGSVTATIDALLAGKTASVSLHRFSIYDVSTPQYVQNPNFWCASLPVQSASPYNSLNGKGQGLTLISPAHVIGCRHGVANASALNGKTLHFVAADGTVTIRTITAGTALTPVVNSAGTWYPDIHIYRLNADMPTGWPISKVLPDNWQDYILEDGVNVPAISFNQFEKALVSDTMEISYVSSIISFYSAIPHFALKSPIDSKRLEFYATKIPGDSGNPTWWPISGDLVLMAVFHWGGAGSGSSVTHFKSQINAAMTALGGGYQLTEIDLSSFPSY